MRTLWRTTTTVGWWCAAVVVAVTAQDNNGTTTKRWSGLATPAADPILGLKALFVADSSNDKMDLTVGAYRTDEGRPWVLPAVAMARDLLGKAKEDWTHEYLPIEGYAPFLRASERLLFGDEGDVTIASAQALSGTGAVRLAFEFFRRHYQGSSQVVYLPATTWANHRNIASDAGFDDVRTYRYLSGATALDAVGFLEDLREAPFGSVVLLHLCAHNPSGVDPTLDAWARVADVVEERRLLPLFDSAYLGFATGDPDRDAAPFRLFVNRGLQPWACVSFSKNFGLYSERVGAVHAVVSDDGERSAVLGHLKKIARAMYSNPPAFGARLVATVLNDPELEASWRTSLTQMANRISDVRLELRRRLERGDAKKNGDWSHVTAQIGMFSFTGLSVSAVHRLRDDHHVFMLDNGRVSMAGLNSGNLPRFADAVLQVLREEEEEENAAAANGASRAPGGAEL